MLAARQSVSEIANDLVRRGRLMANSLSCCCRAAGVFCCQDFIEHRGGILPQNRRWPVFHFSTQEAHRVRDQFERPDGGVLHFNGVVASQHVWMLKYVRHRKQRSARYLMLVQYFEPFSAGLRSE